MVPRFSFSRSVLAISKGPKTVPTTLPPWSVRSCKGVSLVHARDAHISVED